MGGVATGSIKAQLAAKHTGTVNETGNTPIPTATAPKTGKKVEVVATLDVTSVKNIINAATANIKNIGGRYAGATTAAEFIHCFTKDVPWAHLDIAGTSIS